MIVMSHLAFPFTYDIPSLRVFLSTPFPYFL